MKHILNVSEDGSTFSVRTEGDGDVEGIIAFLYNIVSHPGWRPGKNILLDHRALRIHGITVSGIEEVSSYFKSIAPQFGDGKIALVMNRDIDFGIARAWENITDFDVEIKINVFRKLEEAEIWLKK